MKRLILLISFLLPISLFLAGCGGTESKKSNEDSEKQLTIYTTVYPLQYFTEVIGGNVVHVETVYPPGSDEHTFDPSQKDMMKLAESDLFIYVGLGLEGFVEKAKSTLKDEKVTLLEAGGNIHIEEGKHLIQLKIMHKMKHMWRILKKRMTIIMVILIRMFGSIRSILKNWLNPLKMP